MRRTLSIWLLATGFALAIPGEMKDPIAVHLRIFPPHATVYLEAVNQNGSLEPLKPDDKGNVWIDRDRFKVAERGIGLQIGGLLSEAQARAREPVPPVFGYKAASIYIARGYYINRDPVTGSEQVLSNFKEGAYYFPPETQPEFQLQPAPGIGPFLQRTFYWFYRNPIPSAVLLALAGAGAFFLIAVVLPRHKSWLEEQAKVRKFNERLRSLDVQNDLFLGRQFGEWATVKRLGAGGMAVVYKGVSTLTMNEDEAVAVKVMSPDLAQDVEYRRRFDREVQISRTLSHANVVRMIDHGDQDGVLYLVMEYIQGTTLRELLPEKGFPLPEGMPLALGIVNGLIHAHQKGVVHRDLKPDNVMVTDNRLVKVMDLGLAKREESENVTRTGDTFGTPAYMAPEQITGGSLLPATDQYALGVMLFEMFTGRRPFDVADSLTLVMKHLQEPPPRLREYKSQLPEELDSMIDRMLLKDPAKRYKNLVDVQVELQKIQRKYCPS